MARRGLFGFFIFRERIAFQLGLQGAFGRDRGECLSTLLGQSNQCSLTQDTMENVRVKSEFCPPPTCVPSRGAVLNPCGPTRQHPSAQSSARDEATSYGSDANPPWPNGLTSLSPGHTPWVYPADLLAACRAAIRVSVVRRTTLSHTVGALGVWMRKRVSLYDWKQWKRPRTRRRNPLKFGADPQEGSHGNAESQRILAHQHE